MYTHCSVVFCLTPSVQGTIRLWLYTVVWKDSWVCFCHFHAKESCNLWWGSVKCYEWQHLCPLNKRVLIPLMFRRAACPEQENFCHLFALTGEKCWEINMSERFIPTYAVNLSGTLLNEGVGVGGGLSHSWAHRLFQVSACKGLELPEGKEIFASYFIFLLWGVKWNLKNLYESCRSVWLFPQKISRTLFFVLSSPMAAISVDLKASALTNKQQCSSGQPHSSHRSRSRISQFQATAEGLVGVFSRGAGSSCFPFAVTG